MNADTSSMSAPEAPTYRSQNTSVAPSGTSSAPETRRAALQFVALLAQEVSNGTVELPCFPDVVMRIRKALDNPRTTTDQMVMVVGTEPRLAAKLLQTANSVAFNSTGKPLTDLRSAVTRLGQQIVQGTAMAFAVQQMKEEKSLRAIARPLSELWRECIAVASISHQVARRTKISPDEAFLTGLLHGIGRLYVLVRAAGQVGSLISEPSFREIVNSWQAQIGKAVLENWGFAEEISDAVGSQFDYERRHRHEADLTDILVVSIVLANTLKTRAAATVDIAGVASFQRIALTPVDCDKLLARAQHQLHSLHDTLGC